jgi:SAM-dependent methyltransferase
MKLSAQDLETITSVTLQHYDHHAESFWQGTRDHDVRQNIAALLQHITGEPPYQILDFGCGPGRDLKVFAALGHGAIGVEGSPRFAAMARAYSGCTVWQQDFLRLDLPPRYFDGVFANAALFHVPAQELPRVLRELQATLKPGGVLFSSNPRGHNEAGWNGGRYGVYHALEAWRGHLTAAGFTELTHYYRPEGLPREQQPWLASVWRSTDPAAGSGPAIPYSGQTR